MAVDASHYGALLWASRSAFWGHDLAAARQLAGDIERSITGDAGVPGAIRSSFRAGLLALEGAQAEAVEAYRSAVAAWKRFGHDIGVAMTIVDALLVLPSRPEPREWAADARAIFERVDAKPLLRLLDDTVAKRPGAAPVASSPLVESA
jgi:hypothetical protein